MGNRISKFFKRLWGEQEIRVLILGLDGAGKTTILYRLQLGEVVRTVPTIGFNVETVTYYNLRLNVWDLGGQSSIRPYWRCYYASAHAVIYVIDSQDTDRLLATRKELYNILKEEELKNAALLVFANKQDMPGAMKAEEISLHLQLTRLKDRNWTIIGTSAISGDGIDEGMDWLTTKIKEEQ